MLAGGLVLSTGSSHSLEIFNRFSKLIFFSKQISKIAVRKLSLFREYGYDGDSLIIQFSSMHGKLNCIAVNCICG